MLWGSDRPRHGRLSRERRRFRDRGSAPLPLRAGVFVPSAEPDDRQFDHRGRLGDVQLRHGVEFGHRSADRLVSTGGMDDFEPVGFSLDKTKLYFNSSRSSEQTPKAHIASLWVIELKNGKTTRLTNTKQANG